MYTWNKVITVLLCCCSAAILSCRHANSAHSWPKELVMTPGMKITAKNENGKIAINAQGELERIYEWDDKSKRITLIPREEPWYGLLGAYSPGAQFLPLMQEPRIVAQEAELHVPSFREAKRWLDVTPSNDWVYTDGGLAVGFSRAPDRHQISVHVMQIIINGEIPSKVPGANNAAIEITGRKPMETGSGNGQKNGA